jgi:uncharacterized hydantoinase/oxoprolinase family protein
MTQISNTLVNYKTKHKNIQYIINEFDKPLFLNKFYINREGLIYNSDIIKTFREVWKQNPQRLALEFYNEFEFYKIILLVNNIPSVFAFDAVNLKNRHVLVPKKNTILQIIA